MFTTGKGVRKNYKKAFYWSKRAALQDHIPAQYNLAIMHLTGQGTEKNNSLALYWFEKAAKGYGTDGVNESRFNLGTMYYNGQGAPKNYIKAYYWWNQAAQNGHKDAAMWRDDLEKKMTPSQIEKAQVMVID